MTDADEQTYAPVPGETPEQAQARLEAAHQDIINGWAMAVAEDLAKPPEERVAPPSDVQFARDVAEEKERLKVRRHAERALDEEEFEATREPRVRRSAREFAALPKPRPIMERVLAAEVNLLAGPSGAGKSLLGRDWTLHVASGQPWRGFEVPEPRAVVVVASEGTHDFDERWASQPLWNKAADNVYVVDQGVNLLSAMDRRRFIDEFDDLRPGLVVLDLVYACGMADDNGSRDVIPMIAALKEISRVWDAGTLAIGHPGLDSSTRRFRGSSVWRQLAAVEWHLADGRLTCEKSKVDDARRHDYPVIAEYPHLRWLSATEAMGSDADRYLKIQADLAAHPGDSDLARAKRLAPDLGWSPEWTRKNISAIKRAQK